MNRCIVKILSFLLLIITICSAHAHNIAYAATKAKKQSHYDLSQDPRYASIVVNAATGEVISKFAADQIRHPASTTKAMTLYLLFQAIEAKKVSLNTRFTTSYNATQASPTKLYLKEGQTISVRDAIYAMIIKSANDASIVVAEGLGGGSEERFVEMMNRTAKQLGMKDTFFKNPHGLPDREQVTTAADLAKLAIALRRDFPQYYHLFAKKSFIFNGSVIATHNHVLKRYKWADGLKTGFINASGFNIISSASKPNARVIAVVMGAPSAKLRDEHAINLLDRGFSRISRTQVAKSEMPKIPNVQRLEKSATKIYSKSNAFTAYDTSNKKSTTKIVKKTKAQQTKPKSKNKKSDKNAKRA